MSSSNLLVVPRVSVPEVDETRSVSLPPAGARGLDRVLPAEIPFLASDIFTFFLINIRGFVTHEAELNAVLESFEFPRLSASTRRSCLGKGS